MAIKKRGLGKGLGALLGDEDAIRLRDNRSALDEIPLEWIQPGMYQPRTTFDADSLDDLAHSIKAQGVMQPIVVRALVTAGADDTVASGTVGVRYEIIAGERRWRAAQIAGLEKIPVVVRSANDESAIALSLIENVQREDLNPMEEAQALQRLALEFNMTHQAIADALGKSRTAISNSLRLNNLSPEVKDLLANGSIEMGHARALLPLSDQQQSTLAREIVRGQLNVRQAEQKVRNLGKTDPAPSPGKKMDADTWQLQERLSDKFGQPVRIQHTSRGKGKLVISYNSLDELDGILQQFGDLE